MDRLTDVVVAAETFDRARPEFQHDDGAYARILCQTDDD
jgi:hypothetical protein